MAIRADKIDRLKSQLQTSGISQQNNPLFQVINQLIDAVKELIKESNSNSGSSTTVIENIINQTNVFSGEDGLPGEDGMVGRDGKDGPIGPTGATGPQYPLFFTEEIIIEENILLPLQTIYQGGGGGGGGSWELIEARVCTGNANEDFINLGGYTDLLIYTDDIVRSASSLTTLRVSIDNGATFLSGATDYQAIATTGIKTASSTIGFFETNSAAARSASMFIPAINVTGAPKVVFASRNNFPTSQIVTTSAINAIQVLASTGGNLDSGTIYVYGRP